MVFSQVASLLFDHASDAVGDRDPITFTAYGVPH